MSTWRPRLMLRSGVAELSAMRGMLRAQGALDAFDGDGPPVLLLPGFLAGDRSLEPLARHLAAAGYRPVPAGIQRNVDCSERAAGRLADRLWELGEPVALVGHSRGGMLAHVLARRRPELVTGVVTIGAPRRDPLALHPAVLAPALSLGIAGSLGVDGLVRYSCAFGRCCAAFRRDLAAPVAPPSLAIYSRRDGIVDWRACLDPEGRQVEVRSSHCGMAEDRVTLHVVRAFLDDLHAPGLAAAA